MPTNAQLLRDLKQRKKRALIRRAECACILGIHPDTWDDYWKRHEDLILGRHRIGKQNRWPRKVIEAHLEACR